MAYDYETKRIQEIGINNLCNVLTHMPTPEESYILRSKQMMRHKTSDSTKEKIRQSLMGHIVKQSTREKISNSCKGKKKPCSESRKLNIAKSKKPIGGFPDVISPSGIRYSIGILSDFCKEHNLHLPAMCGLLKKYKNAKSHRGWKLYEK